MFIDAGLVRLETTPFPIYAVLMLKAALIFLWRPQGVLSVVPFNHSSGEGVAGRLVW